MPQSAAVPLTPRLDVLNKTTVDQVEEALYHAGAQGGASPLRLPTHWTCSRARAVQLRRAKC